MFAKTLRVFGVGGVMFLIRSPFTHPPKLCQREWAVPFDTAMTQAHATLEDTDRSQCPVQCGRVLGVLSYKSFDLSNDFGDRKAMETILFSDRKKTRIGIVIVGSRQICWASYFLD